MSLMMPEMPLKTSSQPAKIIAEPELKTRKPPMVSIIRAKMRERNQFLMPATESLMAVLM